MRIIASDNTRNSFLILNQADYLLEHFQVSMCLIESEHDNKADFARFVWVVHAFPWNRMFEHTNTERTALDVFNITMGDGNVDPPPTSNAVGKSFSRSCNAAG